MKDIFGRIFQRFSKKKAPALRIFSDDVFLVSYPKSGNTWVRFILGNYISDNHCDFVNSHLLVPDIHFNLTDCEELARPRIIKSHFPYTAEYPKVVYLVRDARDVAVSYYYHQKKQRQIDPEMDFPSFVKMFNVGDHDMFGPWGRHVHSWLDNKHEDILVVRYEDLIEDTVRYFSSILSFCNMEVVPEKVEAAVHAASFNNMQKLEQKQQMKHKVLAKSDTSIPFVRKGKVSQWREYFDDELHSEFMSHHGEAMHRLRYEP